MIIERDGMGFRMKNFSIMGLDWKIQFLGWFMKNQYLGGIA